MMTFRRRANPDGTAGATFFDIIVPMTTPFPDEQATAFVVVDR
jgi:hypothetical protein